MKKFLKYSGLCSLAVAIVAFILMLATPAIVATNSDFAYKGTTAIFGGYETIIIAVHFDASPLALIAWILGLAGLLIVAIGVVLPLLKIKVATKIAGLFNLVAVCCFVIAGVFMFIVIPTFYSANGLGDPTNVAIGAGWVIGGILYIAAGVIAILPAAMDFISKK